MTFSMKVPLLLFRTFWSTNSSRVNRRFLHESISADVPVVNETRIRNQLDKLSVPYKEGYTCLHVNDCCCGTKHKNSVDSTDVFINKRTGFFLCEKCKFTGDWASYSNLLAAAKNGKVNRELYTKHWERFDTNVSDWSKVVACTEPLKNFSDANLNRICREFRLSFCTKSLADKLKIRINKQENLLYFPLEYLRSVVGYKTYDIDGKESTFPRVDCPGFLRHSSGQRTAAVIVANINDFLALISQNVYSYDIICLQYGAKYLPQSTLPFLEKYTRIVLWLGEGSLDATRNIAQKLAEKRCFAVRPLQEQTSASVAVSKKQNISEILSKAKHTWHQYVTTFTGLRDEVLAEIQNNYQVAGVPWKRFPELTKILKGHRRGEMTILTGPTGVGKTTFLSEYSLDLAMQGVNTLWGSFEIKNTRLAKVLLTQFSDGPIPEKEIDYNHLCDKFEELPFFFLTFHGHQDLASVLDAVKHCSYTYDIAHVIIDNVQFMIDVSLESAKYDRFWKQDLMIQSFRKFATDFNCHVTLVIHPKKIEGVDLSVNSIFGGVKASQEADNILIIQRKDLNTFGVKKYLQVCKNRYSGDLGLFPLYFDKQALSFSKSINSSNHLETESSCNENEPWNENGEEDVLESEFDSRN